MNIPLNISLIQPNTVWHDTTANIAIVDRMISSLTDSELIILPEMWNTGFSMTPEPLATTMDGIVVKQMQTWAAEKSAMIGGSVIIEENGKYYNRFLLVDQSGPVVTYDKKHLFTLAGEHKAYSVGHQQVTHQFRDWNIHLNVCYDLRFPVWSRNTTGYDLLIYVANWPSPRHHAWRTLLQARAIENQCFVIGVNRSGSDPNGHTYLGGSTVIDYKGNHLLEMDATENTASIAIDKSQLLTFRSKLDFLSDRDMFTLRE